MEIFILSGAVLLCLLGITLLPGFVPVRFLCAIAVAEPLASLLKRAIFLIGPQSDSTYHAAQIIPAGCVALGFVLVMMHKARLSRTGHWLALFTLCGILSTLLGDGSWAARASSAVDFILPALAFPIAFMASLEDLGRVAKCYIVLLIITVPYAILQFAAGPTFLDRAWASGAASSIQAAKTLAAIDGGLRDFRPYSIYPDPFTYGMFAIAAFGIISAAGALGVLNRRLALAGCTLCFMGAFFTLSRSPVLGVIATLGVFLMLRNRAFRRPAVLLALYAVTFVLVNQFSSFMVENYADSQSGAEDITARFETVSTLSDRSHSLDLLPELLSRENLPGRGYAYSIGTIDRGFEGLELSPLMGSHNIVIGIMLATGIPGLLCLSLFLARLINEGLLNSVAPGNGAKALRWLAASVIAHLLVGLFSGHGVLTTHFYLIAGMLARGGAHTDGAQRPPAQNRYTVRELQQLAIGS